MDRAYYRLCRSLAYHSRESCNGCILFSLQLQQISHTSPDHLMQPVSPDGDIILSNPSLAENGHYSTRVELQWRNLCVDAELPPPSCFKRFREKNLGPRTKPILKNGKHKYK